MIQIMQDALATYKHWPVVYARAYVQKWLFTYLLGEFYQPLLVNLTQLQPKL